MASQDELLPHRRVVKTEDASRVYEHINRKFLVESKDYFCCR